MHVNISDNYLLTYFFTDYTHPSHHRKQQQRSSSSRTRSGSTIYSSNSSSTIMTTISKAMAHRPPRSSSPPTPHPASPPNPSSSFSSSISSSSSSSSSSSYRLLTFVNNLRQSTDEATTSLNEALAHMSSLSAELKLEQKEEKQILSELKETLHQTRKVQAIASETQSKIFELERHNSLLSWQVGMVRVLEEEATEFLDGFRGRLASVQERHGKEMEVEMKKARKTHMHMTEASKGLVVAVAGVQAAKEEGEEAAAQFLAMEQQRDEVRAEMRKEQEETRKLLEEVKEVNLKIQQTDEAVGELETYVMALKNERMRAAAAASKEGGGGKGGGREVRELGG